MKLHLTLIATIFMLLADTANACTVDVVGNRKAYRAASRVFMGEFVSFAEPDSYDLPPKLAKTWKGLDKAKFRIDRAWKGPKRGETELYFNVKCDCPMRLLLPQQGDKLLIFADKDGVVDACNMYVIEMKNDRARDDVRLIVDRLESFWFRTWATVYPF